MPQNYLCVCDRCHNINSAGKYVSRNTYYHHQRTCQDVFSSQHPYLYIYVDHPNRHHLTRSSYYQHCDQLQHQEAESPLSMNVENSDPHITTSDSELSTMLSGSEQ